VQETDLLFIYDLMPLPPSGFDFLPALLLGVPFSLFCLSFRFPFKPGLFLAVCTDYQTDVRGNPDDRPNHSHPIPRGSRGHDPRAAALHGGLQHPYDLDSGYS
jgi:hypothetical protein